MLVLKQEIAKTFISSVLYVSESWTPLKKEKYYPEAVEMLILRRVTNTNCIQRKSNLNVSDEVSESRTRRVNFICHLVRLGIIEGKVLGK